MPFATAFHIPHCSWLIFLLLLSTGCNLSIDVEDHPYPDAIISDPEDAGNPPDARAPDTGPTQGPILLITELMIRPTPPPDFSQELGEYIEIYNAGDEAIDPRDLVIELLETNDRIEVDRFVSSPEEEAVVAGLQPIEPGEFFVFLREDDPSYQITDSLEEGSYYEYGRWQRPISLTNFSRTLRLVEIRGEFQFHIHHQLAWRQGHLTDLDEIFPTELDIRQDIAFGLRPSITTAEEARDPANWCYHLQTFSSGPLLGSPGRPTPASCL